MESVGSATLPTQASSVPLSVAAELPHTNHDAFDAGALGRPWRRSNVWCPGGGERMHRHAPGGGVSEAARCGDWCRGGAAVVRDRPPWTGQRLVLGLQASEAQRSGESGEDSLRRAWNR